MMLEAFLHPLHLSWYLTDKQQRVMVKIKEIKFKQSEENVGTPRKWGRVMQHKHLERT